MGPFKLQLDLPSVIAARVILFAIPQIAIYATIAAFVVRLSYDAKLERPVKIKRYILPTITSAFVLTILGVIVMTTLLGSMFLTLYLDVLSTLEIIILARAGFWLLLWLWAPISIIGAIIVIERTGIRGLSRSLTLTRSYRWVTAGVLYLAVACLFLFHVAYGFLVAWIAGISSLSAAKLLGSAFDSLGVVIFCILITLIYARLCEIKEGVSLDRIDAVFG
ncbi:hypothetical protein [Roseibium aggregatum]|nr:hypothetical protein [Roseibium aggregatum]